ncbi:MAG: exopolysaccharide biosynthesis protein [Opitutales bacterium]
MSTQRLSTELTELKTLKGSEGVTVSDILAHFEKRGFGFFLILLSLPSAMPVPAPGYSTPFGIILALIGLQMAILRPTPWLPQWALRLRLQEETAKKMIDSLGWAFSKMERLIRPRLAYAQTRLALSLVGIVILSLGILMIFPIPLTNTLPAIIIFFLGVGIIEKDGIVLAGAFFFGILLCLFYLAAFAAVLFWGHQGIEEIIEMIKGWLT